MDKNRSERLRAIAAAFAAEERNETNTITVELAQELAPFLSECADVFDQLRAVPGLNELIG